MTVPTELMLEDIAYLAEAADTVNGRRRLDLLIKATLTYIVAQSKSLKEQED